MQNSITTQTTIAIAVAILIGLLGFGYAAYQGAHRDGGKYEKQILSTLTAELAEQIYPSGASPPDTDRLAEQIAYFYDDNYSSLLLDRSGQLVARSRGELLPPEQIGQLPRVRFLSRGPASGHLSLGGKDYVWASRPLHSTQYTFVVIFRMSKDSGGGYFQAIRIPAALALVLIVFASWAAALILNAWFNKYRRLQQELADQLLFDPVSELARPALLSDRLLARLQSARREGKHLAVICIGLEHLQKIRSCLEPEQGEELLLQFRDLVQGALRESDNLGLGSADTLVVVLPGTDSREAAIVARKLHGALAAPIKCGADSFHVQCHMGVAIYPTNGQSSAELLENAAIALRVSRQANNEFTLYDKDLESFNPDQLRYVNDLRRAISDNQLYLLMQPKIDLQTRSLAGAEVLVRWRDSEGREKLPDEFIPVAEQAGLITPLTQWVLENSMIQYQQLCRFGARVPLAVNISTCCLHDPAFETMLHKQLEKSDIPDGALKLEITESAMMENQARAMDILHRLTARGIGIAIDDFGTGYSSLTYLRKLPISELKIDKSFVTRMLNDHNDLSIVRSTIDLAHDLGLKVVAEGIEDAATLNELVSNGCDTGQGYYFSQPLTMQQMMEWIEENDPAILQP